MTTPACVRVVFDARCTLADPATLRFTAEPPAERTASGSSPAASASGRPDGVQALCARLGEVLAFLSGSSERDGASRPLDELVSALYSKAYELQTSAQAAIAVESGESSISRVASLERANRSLQQDVELLTRASAACDIEYRMQSAQLKEVIADLEQRLAQTEGRTVSSWLSWTWGATRSAVAQVVTAPGKLKRRQRPAMCVFSAFETEQIAAVQAAYTVNVGGDLPAELQTQPAGDQAVRPAHELPQSNENVWQSRVPQDAPLMREGRAVLTHICAYQASRLGRRGPFNHSYADDPCSMVLAELKGWVVDTLGTREQNAAALRYDIEARVNYLAALLAASVFPPGRGRAITMQSVLESVRATLAAVLERLPAVPQASGAAAAPATPVARRTGLRPVAAQLVDALRDHADADDGYDEDDEAEEQAVEAASARGH